MNKDWWSFKNSPNQPYLFAKILNKSEIDWKFLKKEAEDKSYEYEMKPIMAKLNTVHRFHRS